MLSLRAPASFAVCAAIVVSCSQPERLLGVVVGSAATAGAGGVSGTGPGGGQQAEAGAGGVEGLGAVPPIAEFTGVAIVEALAGALSSEMDPSMTADGLELFLASHELGNYNLYSTLRASRDEPWQSPTLIEELSTDALELTPEISEDGLTLYFSSDRESELLGSHIWVSRRAARGEPWQSPELVRFSTHGDEEFSPSVTEGGRRIAFAANRGSEIFDLYEATRLSLDDSFGEPEHLTALSSTEASDSDPAYYWDGLGLIYSSRRFDLGGIFESTRASFDEPFGEPVYHNEVHDVDELDGWISNDGSQLLFVSRRDTGDASRIYEAFRIASP